MMVIKEITELTHMNVILKCVQTESLRHLEGLPKILIKILLNFNANLASEMSNRFKKIGKWKISVMKPL
jgi:hypothetical protein